ncbi:hypothetical protein HDU85_003212 [Gaertneriomyces sp. JEL0708]|nr:hypothetical protein HDU85_003212 [Gaertneriomyces sp. JEL0708]
MEHRRRRSSALLLSLVLLATLSGGKVVAAKDESYAESLDLTHLGDGKVLAQFTFNSRIGPIALQKAQGHHYESLPRPIGEIIQSFGVDELHLTFTQGVWNYEKWGYTAAAAPSGAQLWAWFNATHVDTQWKHLTHALAGLYCGSLNQMDVSVTAAPHLSLRPEGSFSLVDAMSDLKLRYGSLPREAVCTENLTPWAKLLPCQLKAGLSTLLNAYKLFDSNYYSMGTHIVPACETPSCTRKGIMFSQTLSVVLDPLRTDNRNEWSLKSLLNRSLNQSCAAAVSTRIALKSELSGETEFLFPPESTDMDANGIQRGIYSMAPAHDLDVGFSWHDANISHSRRDDAYIRMERYLKGYGNERGGIAVDLYNHHPHAYQTVTYLQPVPWYLKLYMHTLQLETSHEVPSDVLKRTHYQTAIDRLRPAVLELELALPPNSTTTISVDFDKSFIKYTEHPPDANRGFDVGPGMLSFVPQNETQLRRMYTTTLLVSLPTPDFSMPYNVITLTCTLMALFFGGLFNLLTRTHQPISLAIKEKGTG